MEFLNESGELREAKCFDQIDNGRYKLVGLRLFTTRYETRVVAVTEDFEIFLPREFSAIANTTEFIDKLNADNRAHPMIMVYEGMTGGGGPGHRIKIHFEKLKLE